MRSPKNQRIIQIDITNACQHECSNCTRFCGHHKKPFFMNFETFKRAVNSLDGYQGTIGMMGGEPTMHPEFEKFTRYLGEHIPEENKKKVNNFIYPQKDFMRSIHNQELENTIGYPYETGDRDCVLGAGLWSAMVDTYKRHYEIIQDTFRMQAVNDHGNPSFHAPILVTRKELGIPDDEWIKMRDNCWMQNVWSATITPKGCFFCEVAGALDMLFNGPGGWPIEPGWWKRTPEQFGDQLHWCEMCGMALNTFSRNANEEIDDVSPEIYEKLKTLDSKKVREGRVNVLKITNGEIAEESKAKASELRKDHYWMSYESRFSGKSILYPEGFEGIAVYRSGSAPDRTGLEKNCRGFDRVFVITEKDAQKETIESWEISKVLKIVSFEGQKFGYALYEIMKLLNDRKNAVIFTSDVKIDEACTGELKKMIINPGTMHYIRPEKKYSNQFFSIDESTGFCAMFTTIAQSIKEMGFDTILNADGFDEIVKAWEVKKVVEFSESMEYDCPDNRIMAGKKYILYGTGRNSCHARDIVEEGQGIIVDYCNSFKEEQGKEFNGKMIISPEELVSVQIMIWS